MLPPKCSSDFQTSLLLNTESIIPGESNVYLIKLRPI